MQTQHRGANRIDPPGTQPNIINCPYASTNQSLPMMASIIPSARNNRDFRCREPPLQETDLAQSLFYSEFEEGAVKAARDHRKKLK
jgi:hypothetical protein